MVTTTSTTLTFHPTSSVTYDVKPNLGHPIYKENPERSDGVEAALRYLYKKGVDVCEEYGRDIYTVNYQ